MAYRIQSPRATFLSMRDASDKTGISHGQIRELCRDPHSGWTMVANGGSRADANHQALRQARAELYRTQDQARAEAQRTRSQAVEHWSTPAQQMSAPLPAPVARAVPPDHTIAQVLSELISLRQQVESLRGEVTELTAQALNVLTLPPGTQLNLPFTH